MSDGVNVWRPNFRRAAMALGVRVGFVKRADSAPSRSSAAARAGAGPARKPSEEEVHALKASSADKQVTRAADDARAPDVEVKDRFRMSCSVRWRYVRSTGGKAQYR